MNKCINATFYSILVHFYLYMCTYLYMYMYNATFYSIFIHCSYEY